MRTKKISCRQKFAIVIFIITIIIFTHRSMFTFTSAINANIYDKTNLQTIKRMAKDERLAQVNKISSKFAPLQQTQAHETHLNIDRIQETNKDVRQVQGEAMKQQQDMNLDKKSYLRYLRDVNKSEIENPYVNLHQYEFTLNNKNACNGNVLVLVLIHSDPRKNKERKMIRDTWGSVKFYSGVNIVPMFLLAEVADNTTHDNIVKESKTHLDIIQGNFLDSYRNLTYKCVMGLHWVQNFCNHTKFVVKVDDDTMIDMYHLVRFLLKTSNDGNLENMLYCSIYSNQGPRRTTDDKWYVSENEYPYSKYPPYCEGFAYIMSNDVTRKLYNASRYVKFYWVDDVYITGFAALKSGITQRKMEVNHGYDLMEASRLSKSVQNSMFLLAKYDHLRRNWYDAWNAIKSYHKIN